MCLLLVQGCGAASAAEPSGGVSDGRYVMGTVLELTLHGVESVQGRATLDALFDEASRLERLVSSWDPASEVSRVNRDGAASPQPVSTEVAELLRRARDYAALSGGAFDVSVGPLVALWKRAAERDAPPGPGELEVARALVGPALYRVGRDRTVSLAREGVSLDLGGIAKGYAIDRMLPVLEERGVTSALLNFGQSSTWARGAPPGEPGWRLLVRGPGDRFLGTITLRDAALSVSGSLGQWVEIGGRRYGHVVDPRSGHPLTRRRQALVVAPDATIAEALSVAMLILGEEEGVALVAAQPGCEGLLVDADGGSWETAGWDTRTRFEACAPDDPICASAAAR